MDLPFKFIYSILSRNPQDIKYLYMTPCSWTKNGVFLSRDGKKYGILYAPHKLRKEMYGEVIPLQLFLRDEGCCE